jgi:hypothetical protein
MLESEIKTGHFYKHPVHFRHSSFDRSNKIIFFPCIVCNSFIGLKRIRRPGAQMKHYSPVAQVILVGSNLFAVVLMHHTQLFGHPEALVHACIAGAFTAANINM